MNKEENLIYVKKILNSRLKEYMKKDIIVTRDLKEIIEKTKLSDSTILRMFDTTYQKDFKLENLIIVITKGFETTPKDFFDKQESFTKNVNNNCNYIELTRRLLIYHKDNLGISDFIQLANLINSKFDISEKKIYSSNILDIFEGRKKCTINTFLKILKGMNLTINAFFNDSEKMEYIMEIESMSNEEVKKFKSYNQKSH